MSEAPTCCGAPMDPTMAGGWICPQCGHAVPPWTTQQDVPDPYAVPDMVVRPPIDTDLSLELDEARARNDELEHRLSLAIAKELRIRSRLQECIALISDDHLEGARVAARAREVLLGEEAEP